MYVRASPHADIGIMEDVSALGTVSYNHVADLSRPLGSLFTLSISCFWRLSSEHYGPSLPPLSRSSLRPSAKTFSELSPLGAWHSIPISLVEEFTQLYTSPCFVSFIRPAAPQGFRVRIRPRKSFSVCLIQGLCSANTREMKARRISRPYALETI